MPVVDLERVGRRVLIAQPGFLGDAALAGALAASLVDAGHRVGLLVRSPFESLFAGVADSLTLHVTTKRRGEESHRLLDEIRTQSYDTALLSHRSVRSALVALRAAIPRRVGYRGSAGGMFLTGRIDYRIGLHEVARNAALAAAAGIPVAPLPGRPWLVPSGEAVARVRERGGAAPIVIAPGSVWGTKRWLPSRYADVARQLELEVGGVVVVGSRSEVELCRTVARDAGLGADRLLVDLDLDELVALMAIARIAITNDSAPLHIAQGAGTQVLALFGPTVPEIGFGPMLPGSTLLQRTELACRPCNIHGPEVCPLGTHACMERIGVGEVMLAARGLLEGVR